MQKKVSKSNRKLGNEYRKKQKLKKIRKVHRKRLKKASRPRSR